MFLDWTIIILLPAILLALYAQFKVNSTFSKYSEVYSSNMISGHEAAEIILNSEIPEQRVEINRISGHLTDHYDPRSKTLNLSESVYNSSSLAAIGVAAHEAGHAIQHARFYVPLILRNKIVPLASFGSSLSFPLLFIGFIFQIKPLIDIGILFFSAAVVFHIITLPVEFNASSRALKLIEEKGIVNKSEVPYIREVLSAAALTYVASALMALLQLIRLLIMRDED